jgi:Uma2 family endonuclease
MFESPIRPIRFNGGFMGSITKELAIPSLDELYRMTSEPDKRVVIKDVDWAFYEQLVDSFPPRAHIHVDYDGKDVEIMSPGRYHEVTRRLLGQLAEAVAQVLRVPYKSLGQTTWTRKELARGLESDECYIFQPDKLAAVGKAKARKSMNIADYPNPDLSIEVDISPPKIDRAGIYAALRVPEVWRFDGENEQVIIERLSDDGSYHAVDDSGFLPIRADEVRRWVVDENSDDEAAWAERLRAWVAAELAPRRAR